MSLVYPAGGATAALGVVGLCKSSTGHFDIAALTANTSSRYAVQRRGREIQRTYHPKDLYVSTSNMLLSRLDNFSKQYPHTHGLIWVLVYV